MQEANVTLDQTSNNNKKTTNKQNKTTASMILSSPTSDNLRRPVIRNAWNM